MPPGRPCRGSDDRARDGRIESADRLPWCRALHRHTVEVEPAGRRSARGELSIIIRLRWIALEPEFSAAQAFWPVLDDAEHMQADRFRFAVDRAAYIAAHGLVRMLLGEALGLPPGAVRFQSTDGGKPQIDPSQNAPDLRFSLSHTRGMVACAFGRRDDLGIDVEFMAPGVPVITLARRFFCPCEAQLVAAAAEERQPAVFYRLWTLKEAFVKGTGQGLATPLDSFFFSLDPVSIGSAPEQSIWQADALEAWSFAEFEPSPQHRLALASHRPAVAPRALDARAVLFDELQAELGRPRP